MKRLEQIIKLVSEYEKIDVNTFHKNERKTITNERLICCFLLFILVE
ncbi:DeoR family transcriptional regulator [Streptococcus pneumoniae]|nr:DeoR family transcriptional regulator [Streptococcus pneumoniae]VNW43132.1 DeoR family transcriptional regulator [Streptococcus pneumoniae]